MHTAAHKKHFSKGERPLARQSQSVVSALYGGGGASFERGETRRNKYDDNYRLVQKVTKTLSVLTGLGSNETRLLSCPNKEFLITGRVRWGPPLRT